MRTSLIIAALLVLFTAPGAAQTRDENWAVCESGDPAKGIAACTALIEGGRETPQNLAIAHSNRGITYSDKGDFPHAIADYERALQLNPYLAEAMNSLAWDLATMPAADLRDGRRAVELAEKAVALDSHETGFLDTLAAAYAEAGRFDDAVHTQQRAITRLQQTKGMPAEVIADFQSRLKLYQSDTPFHRTR